MPSKESHSPEKRHDYSDTLLASMVAAFAGISGMRYFVDQSVRNYYLHRLDWEEVGPDDAPRRQLGI
jgi:hypothetical protein